MAYKINKQYRLPGFDYSKNCSYFITINAKDREHFFGEIIEDEIIHSEIGKFLEENFISIKQKISYLKVDVHSILPNHLHMIITITNENHKYKEIIKGLQPLVSNSISSFCNHLKGKTTTWCNDNDIEFKWQERFHDRIIRNQEEYERIYHYIRNNVKNWKDDVENVKKNKNLL
jgi:putative transposase